MTGIRRTSVTSYCPEDYTEAKNTQAHDVDSVTALGESTWIDPVAGPIPYHHKVRPKAVHRRNNRNS